MSLESYVSRSQKESTLKYSSFMDYDLYNSPGKTDIVLVVDMTSFTTFITPSLHGS